MKKMILISNGVKITSDHIYSVCILTRIVCEHLGVSCVYVSVWYRSYLELYLVFIIQQSKGSVYLDPSSPCLLMLKIQASEDLDF